MNTANAEGDVTMGNVRLRREVWRLLRPFWPIALLSSIMGGLSGLATAALLAAITGALGAGQGISIGLIFALAGLCALILVGEIVSDIGTNVVGQRIIAGLRGELCAKVLRAPIAEIERYRVHRLIAVLNGDVDTISNLSFMFSAFAIAVAITLGCLVYLVILSPLMFLLVLTAIAIGILAQVLARISGLKRFGAARQAEDELQKQYRAMTEGAKELRINRQRRSRLFGSDVGRTIGRIRDLRLQAVAIFCSANAFGSALFFVLISLLLALPSAISGADAAVVSGFVVVLLYMKGPVQQVVGALPLIGRANVAFMRIADLSARLANPEPHLAIEGAAAPARGIETIALSGVRYAFPAVHGTKPFELGPIDLTINRGEILFIVGENGSGKTTLIKLILGLYEPQAGTLRLDGKPVGPDERDDYRQLFSAVFFDYYLFDDLLFKDQSVPAAVDRQLRQFELADKVTITDGAFSTTDLSAGQRKRLAFIQAYLEQRPVLVFDEWAAEQDPTFRRVFYTELLPDLKRQGKTLVVISHDDRYFHVADRLVRIDAGRIGEERHRRPIAAALPEHAALN
jgi:putative pyoverdin transport system ATP-binding/permease protein